MSDAENDLLPAFISWACLQQRRLIKRGRAYVTTLQVGRATNNRAVTFKVEEFKIESNGWIGSTLNQAGVLMLWENGCADAEWATPADLDLSEPRPSYQQHWDNLEPQQIEVEFAPFLANFESL